jgi:hypothetical protein
LVWWSITLTLTVYRPIAANPTNCGAWPNQVGESPHLAETAPAKCYAAGCGSTKGTERHREKHRRASGNPTGVQILDHLLPIQPTVERNSTHSVNPNTLPKLHRQSVVPLVAVRPFCWEGTAKSLAVPVATRPAEWYARPTRTLVQGRWPDHCPVTRPRLRLASRKVQPLCSSTGGVPARPISCHP